MPVVQRPSGVAVTLPAAFQVADASTPPPTTAARRSQLGRGRQFGPVPMPSAAAPAAADSPLQAALVAAFEQQDMALVDQLDVVVPPVGSTRRAAAATPPPAFGLNVPLAAHEDAAVLLEQDGFYSWHLPDETSTVAAPVVRGLPRAAPVRHAQFSIALPAEAAGPATQRGVVKDFIVGKVKAFIFKFAGRVVVGQALKFLERKVQTGLVRMPGLDPAAWLPLGDAGALKLPTARPARILLFIHGTFSSTVSAYAALTVTPWGRALLESAQGSYDAVLGFDHATLSEDPLENATELLTALQGIDWAYPPHFDVVTHSRGGLVLRSLLELLLPLTNFAVQVERVVFVGVTNGGTLLASPANWQALVDMQTNLAAGACQLLGMFPQTKVAGVVLNEIVQGLGAFVKYLATTAVTDRQVPGLAAMEPTGDFIRHLNEQQPNQPTIAQSYYCAITSEFKPQVFGGEHEPKELPARFLQWLGGSFMRGLMREANDLVVNTASMTSIDPAVGSYLKDSLAFEPNPQVYHTNYFVWPKVVNALARWLRLPVPANGPAASPAAAPKRGAGRTRRAPVAAPASLRPTAKPGSFVEEELPAAVDLDVYVAAAEATVAEALQAVRTLHPSYVVVRHVARNAPQDYVFTAEDILHLARKSPQDTLYAVLRLAGTPPSAVYQSGGRIPAAAPAVSDPPQWGPLATDTPGTHAVVLRQGRPVGVLPPAAPPLTSTELVALARQVSRPRQERDLISRRRAMPTFTDEFGDDMALLEMPMLGAAAPGPVVAMAGIEAVHTTRKVVRNVRSGAPKTPKAMPAPVTCHFRAEMDQEVRVGRPTVVEMLISREMLAAAGHPAAAGASASADASQPLQVQVLPKVNFDFAKPDDAAPVEVAVPAPGAPQSLYFTLKATHAGEGEVWVQVRQGQLPLVTLSLKPQVVDGATASTKRVQVAATATEAAPAPAVHQLVITERRNGEQISYHFELQLPDLGVLRWGETKPFVGDRSAYVANIYEEIENRWLSNQDDSQNFTAELRAIGGTLFDELIPSELQQLLWQHRADITSILVIAEEPFIPWEMVHLHAPGKALGSKQLFLGQLGLVRWLHNAGTGWPRQQLQLRPGKCRYVIPHYPHPDYVLPEAEKEEDFMRDTLKAKPLAPTAQAVRTLLQRPGTFDLLHFACHGDANHDNIANAQLILEGRLENGSYLPDYLSATTVEQYARFGSAAPIIVLNACQAGRTGYKLTGIGGFAQSFLRGGAGAFVGTLWSVGDTPARSFTETFYQRLLAGDTLAEATTAAREAAREAGDATWLAYAVYGHPYAKVG